MPRRIIGGGPPPPITVGAPAGANVQPQIPATDEDKTALLVSGVLHDAEECRDDLAAFFSFVMRHETTHVPLDAAPHQRLMFDFLAHHDRVVMRLPVGCSKTVGMVATTEWLLGRDVTRRGAFVSKTRGQAQKPLSMIADYIAEPLFNAPLTLVFPHLRKSPRPKDPWTQTAITVDRPAAIRDSSLVAVGIGSAIAGARLSWIVADDVIDDENSATPQMRDQVASQFDGRILSRLDPAESRAVVCNTPWHREDLTYHLEQDAGWSCLTMDIYGNVRISNASPAWMHRALNEHIRPSTIRVEDKYDWFRLRAFDPDPEEATPLWPERYSAQRIKEIRYGRDGQGGMLPHEFARLFLCEPLSESALRCQREWVDKCKHKGAGTRMVDKYEGAHPTYTGVDVGVGTARSHDLTVLFTMEVLPDGSRRVLNIWAGRITGPEIVDRIVDTSRRYKSSVWVEGNAAQKYLAEFVTERAKDVPIHAHTTTRAGKLSVDFGVESVFTELRNGAWVIPCDSNYKCEKEIQDWIDGMLFYQPPPNHTSDHLMASWIAREAARRGMRGNVRPHAGRRRELIETGAF